MTYDIEEIQEICRKHGSATKLGVAWLGKSGDLRFEEWPKGKFPSRIPAKHIKVVLEYSGADWMVAFSLWAMSALGVDTSASGKSREDTTEFYRSLAEISKAWEGNTNRIGREIPKRFSQLDDAVHAVLAVMPSRNTEAPSVNSLRRRDWILLVEVVRLAIELGQFEVRAHALEENRGLVKMAAQRNDGKKLGPDPVRDLKATLVHVLQAHLDRTGRLLGGKQCFLALANRGKTLNGRKIELVDDRMEGGKWLEISGKHSRPYKTILNWRTECVSKLRRKKK